jgi:hypothetical protein
MTLALVALAGAGSSVVEAVSLSEAYLFSTLSSPGTPATPSFTFTGTGATGFELTLDGSGVVTGVQPTGDVTRPISTPLPYQGHSGTIDGGETYGSITTHVNSEVGRLDDIGAVDDGSPDAILNVDFGDDASVRFGVPAGLTSVLIGEDAGWDRFRLQYCPDATCAGATTLINWTGASAGAVTSILAPSTDFQTDDTAPEIDQLWLFVFDAPLPGGLLRLTETVNGSPLAGSDGVRLEVDFVGGTVPEPGTLVLLGSGLAALGLGSIRSRRRREPGGRARRGGPRPRCARGA